MQFFKDKAKDCLWFIAQRFYKKPALWPKIYDANRDQIKNPNFIRPGWKLRVPKLAPVKKADAAMENQESKKEEAAPVKEPASEEKPAEN